MHQHPELSHLEQRTAAAVADQLGRAGFEVHSGVGGTGVVGILRNGDGPTVLLRADMDALPVKEDTGLPYASTAVAIPAASGDPVPVAMPAATIYTTCLLGAAQLLANGEKHWGGKLVVVFQPAEETVDGARGMVADGLAELVGPVDVALGQHVARCRPGGWPQSPACVRRVTVYGSLCTAAAARLDAACHRRPGGVGRSDRAAPADRGLTRIEAGQPAVLTVGSIHAGTKANIIADRAELQINIRSYSESVRATLLAAIRRIVTRRVRGLELPARARLRILRPGPLTDNNPGVTARAVEAFTATLGEQVMIDPPRVLGSEVSAISPAASARPSYCVRRHRS